MRLPYPRVLIPEAEGGFSAQILGFPGCFAQGETAEETARNLESAAESWLEAVQDGDWKLSPPPTIVVNERSGR